MDSEKWFFRLALWTVPPYYVRLFAASFEDFLRLLLACRDANLLEQAWQWGAEEFYEMLDSGVLDKPVYDVLDRITETMHLTPMEKPWEYMNKLQASFDYRKIQYTEDFYDPDMNDKAHQEQEWAVCFVGSVCGHHVRTRAGKEIPVGKEFEFADRKWVVPAVYSCGKGLVVDLCMRVDPCEYQRFFDKWTAKLDGRDDNSLSPKERMQAELENPLNLDICPEVCVNGKKLKWNGSCGTCYTPSDDSEWNNIEIMQMMEHYHLDHNFAWPFVRAHFPWVTG